MNSIVISSTNEVLQFALEEIFIKFSENLFMEDFDFVIFAISPEYPYVDINRNIKKIFQTDKYLAFNSITSIANSTTVKGVSAIFFKFEKNAKIDYMICECGEEREKIIKNYLKEDGIHLIFATYNPDITQFLESLNFKIPVSVAGGYISGEEIEDEFVGFLYIDDKIIKKGMVILTFKNVEFDIQIATGYKPIGPSYRVNLAKGHKVYVIEYEDATLISKNLLKGLEGIEDLWYSPILVKRDKLIPRTFKDIKEGLYVEFFGEVRNNEEVYLSFTTIENLLKEDIVKAKALKQNLKNIDVVFNFSCVAREYILGKNEKDELREFSKITNAPMFGFYTFGEIKSDGKDMNLYNQTSLIVGIKE